MFAALSIAAAQFSLKLVSGGIGWHVDTVQVHIITRKQA